MIDGVTRSRPRPIEDLYTRSILSQLTWLWAICFAPQMKLIEMVSCSDLAPRKGTADGTGLSHLNMHTCKPELEGGLIWLALRVLQLHTNVILDFGFWSTDERSSLRWFANQIGAKSQVIYLPVDLESLCCLDSIPLFLRAKRMN